MPLLSSVLVFAFAATALARNCGFRIADCIFPEVCMAVDPTCTVYGTCAGTCERDPYVYCGGFANVQKCPDGQECLTDPRINPGPDLPGFCGVASRLQRCGDVPRACPEGMLCFDDRDDRCEPENGLACRGVCMYPLPLVP